VVTATALDNKLRPTATKLLQKFGKVLTLRSSVTAAYNPTTRTAAVSYVDYSFRGAIVSPSQDMLTSGLALSGDRVVIADALTLGAAPPKPTDLLTIDGVDWTVLNVLPTYSGEFAAIYKLIVRT
jgi:hypothetical protein